MRKLAAEASGLLGDERAMDSLLVALEDNNMWVRYAAVRALGELGAHEAVDALLMALEDEVEPVKLAAVEALGKLGHPRATQALVTLKQHIEYDFRTVVAEALNAVITGSVHDLTRGSLTVSLSLFRLSLLTRPSGRTSARSPSSVRPSRESPSRPARRPSRWT